MNSTKPKNIFQGNYENVYHLSVGALVYNDDNEILCHYYNTTPKEFELDDIYVLMRETLENGETLEECVHRGLGEEFGIKGKIEKFLGTLVRHFPIKDRKIEKSTLYFLVKKVGDSQELRDLESDETKYSELKWEKAEFLIQKMKEQSIRYPERTDLDESEIVEKWLAIS